ncbi:ornithine cyclodeaminase family protein [Sulfurisphaera javensis]|uniref:ornithine cyclodeaminase family protein n=1 Tax=Sulfurisphaera javensis TaxID=2049879 RepID=UPI0034E89571
MQKILNFKDSYETVKEAFLLLYQKLATNTKRVRTSFHGSVLTYQSGGIEHYLGFKVFVKGTFFSMLFNDSGDPLLMAEADLITRIRTGAISVLASDYLAKRDYNTVGIIGLGKQGKFQVKAFYELKPGIKIKVFSKERLEEELKKIEEEGIKVEKAKDYKDVCNADVIVTITNSKDPFLKYEFLNRGTHINALGSNLPERVELYPEVIKNSSLIVVEDKDQAKEEAGDLIMAEKMNMLDWNKVKTLAEVIAGVVKRNSEDDITVFKSMGIGLEDVAVLKLLYEKAKKYGLGSEIDIRGKWYLV